MNLRFIKRKPGRICRQNAMLQSGRSVGASRLPHKLVRLYWIFHHKCAKFLKNSLTDVIGKVRNWNADRSRNNFWLWRKLKFHWIFSSRIINSVHVRWLYVIISRVPFGPHAGWKMACQHGPYSQALQNCRTLNFALASKFHTTADIWHLH
jgi:hypothetical protein